ncbi:lipoate--protein ligase family protein [Shimazuella sp. AN120528]|uniref:lipoate--protein ligase family protein n=1 Tax=Shimazuella soli TaxID=1892854 RepID=UPI001F100CFA|nr:lipoate--protein ligase family protein [Shimazuella soli]MCH5584150.1 lipoate--protein ligase family protein [Shimazuella soli]
MLWRYIPYETKDPYWNMAIDEAILIAHRENRVPPTLRFYGWSPATLSIGYFQRSYRQIDHDNIKKCNLGFVRRITGGRAVFHDRELTYSVILSEKNELVSSSVQETYRKLNQAFTAGLENLKLSLTTETPNYLENNTSAACFDAPGSGEFLIEGRKAIGSAQTRQQGVLLQHGSILLDFDWETFDKIFLFPNEESKAQLKSRMGTLSQLLKRDVNLDETIRAIYYGFEEGLGITFQKDNLTAYEYDLAKKLVAEKYRTEAWNFKR